MWIAGCSLLGTWVRDRGHEGVPVHLVTLVQTCRLDCAERAGFHQSILSEKKIDNFYQPLKRNMHFRIAFFNSQLKLHESMPINLNIQILSVLNGPSVN